MAVADHEDGDLDEVFLGHARVLEYGEQIEPGALHLGLKALGQGAVGIGADLPGHDETLGVRRDDDALTVMGRRLGYGSWIKKPHGPVLGIGGK